MAMLVSRSVDILDMFLLLNVADIKLKGFPCELCIVWVGVI